MLEANYGLLMKLYQREMEKREKENELHEALMYLARKYTKADDVIEVEEIWGVNLGILDEEWKAERIQEIKELDEAVANIMARERERKEGKEE